MGNQSGWEEETTNDEDEVEEWEDVPSEVWGEHVDPEEDEERPKAYRDKAKPRAASPLWQRMLRRNENGAVLPTLLNAATSLELCPQTTGLFAKNARDERVYMMKSPPWDHREYPEGDTTFPRSLVDSDLFELRRFFSSPDRGMVEYKKDVMWDGLIAYADRCRFDPFLDWLEKIEWDKKPRLGSMLCDYWGADDTPFVRAIGIRWMISAVARTFAPGCQADYVLTIEGDQGARKSSSLRVLFSTPFFTDDAPAPNGKDTGHSLQGPACIEYAELDAFSRSEIRSIKAFVTRRVDRFRLPYGRAFLDMPRRCVFAASTNEDDYLYDQTGGRRWWPFEAKAIDLAAIERDRAQLFAEAVALFRKGERWWLTPEEEAWAKSAQKGRQAHDPWHERIAKWAKIHSPFTMLDLLKNGLDLEPGRIDRGAQTRAGYTLKVLGYTKARKMKDGVRVNVFTAPGKDQEEPEEE